MAIGAVLTISVCTLHVPIYISIKYWNVQSKIVKTACYHVSIRQGAVCMAQGAGGRCFGGAVAASGGFGSRAAFRRWRDRSQTACSNIFIHRAVLTISDCTFQYSRSQTARSNIRRWRDTGYPAVLTISNCTFQYVFMLSPVRRKRADRRLVGNVKFRSNGERSCLRVLLLHHVRGATCHAALRT